MPDDLQKLFRPPENCKFCRGVKEAPRLQNVSPDEFEDTYAYSGGPVVITDATSNWTALEVSSIDNICQFYSFSFSKFPDLRLLVLPGHLSKFNAEMEDIELSILPLQIRLQEPLRSFPYG